MSSDPLTVSFTTGGERLTFTGDAAVAHNWLARHAEAATGTYTIVEPAIGASALECINLDAQIFRQQDALPGPASDLEHILREIGVLRRPMP